MNFGFELFAGNKSYIMLSNKKNVTNNVTKKLVYKFFADRGLLEKWNAATDAERASAVSAMKYRVRPVALEYRYYSTGAEYLSIYALKHGGEFNEYNHYSIHTVPQDYYSYVVIFDDI